FISYIRITLVSKSAGTLERDDPHSSIRFRVQKRCCYFAVINILQTSLSEPHACHRADRISHTAIDLDPNDQLLFIGATRIIEIKHSTAEQRHTSPEQLSRTHVPV